MIKGIIFDLGNTLLHFQGNLPTCEQHGAQAVTDWYLKKKRVNLNSEALRQAILTFRAEATQQAIETGVEQPMHQSISKALQSVNAPQQAYSLTEQAARIFFTEEEAQYLAVADALDTLKVLRAKNLNLALLSNATNDPLIQRLVNQHGLRPYLSPVFSSAGLGWRKPYPQPFAVIAKRWELPPQEIAVVGDTLFTDMGGAHNVGMRGVLITRFESSTNAQNRHIIPDLILPTLAELPAAIEQL